MCQFVMVRAETPCQSPKLKKQKKPECKSPELDSSTRHFSYRTKFHYTRPRTGQFSSKRFACQAWHDPARARHSWFNELRFSGGNVKALSDPMGMKEIAMVSPQERLIVEPCPHAEFGNK
jgi:hypothetical protein